MEEYLNKQELANKLKISVTTVERLRKKGLPEMKIGRQVRFKMSEVEEWMKGE